MLSGGEAREAAAFGVPDERLGQAIVVVAVARGDAAVAEAALRERLAARAAELHAAGAVRLAREPAAQRQWQARPVGV